MEPHLVSSSNLLLAEVNGTKKNDAYTTNTTATKYNDNDGNKPKIVWFNAFVFLVLHLIALYGLWLSLTLQVSWKTTLWSFLYLSFASVGVTGGAHRLWSHRSYKAKLPLRIFLMLGQTASLQNDIHEWVRDHRVHHKFTDTNADPHNSSRGFFFCHVGWLMMKKHEDVKIKGKTIDMSDVAADPVVQWQRKYYIPLVILLTFVIPTFIPWYFWGEAAIKSFYVCICRFVLQLNGTWAVNSAAHLWGYKPYDQTINPVENKYVSVIGFGEGWHNYHHTFPWDYKAAELGNYSLNWTTGLLDLMAYLGQAYDLRTVSEDLIRKRANRTGDGSWKDGKIDLKAIDKKKNDTKRSQEEYVWGWDDKDMKDEDKKHAHVFNKEN
ncbi:acyl-CoA Delta(11) desaturase-like [Diorhabda carinulata]|uniref:acyl-CoA Delta(11) desaturase-like n=1 Tax=Diorhabda carinulata TaxID=1163345 RepID=UPI0025A2E981|nr:acyl-CoA Delta(11) desaturase-like [Diorhabda carinulata]